MCMDVGGGDQKKQPMTTWPLEQQVPSGVWVNVQNEHLCAALVG